MVTVSRASEIERSKLATFSVCADGEQTTMTSRVATVLPLRLRHVAGRVARLPAVHVLYSKTAHAAADAKCGRDDRSGDRATRRGDCAICCCLAWRAVAASVQPRCRRL